MRGGTGDVNKIQRTPDVLTKVMSKGLVSHVVDTCPKRDRALVRPDARLECCVFNCLSH